MLIVNVLKAMLLLLFFSVNLGVSAQEFFELHLNKTVLSFIDKYPVSAENRPSCLSLYSCSSFEYHNKQYTNADYKLHIKNYQLPINTHDFFELMTTLHPREIWRGNSVFQLLYRASTNQSFHKNSPDLKIEIGDTIYLELIPRLGFLSSKIPVVFQIIEIDESSGVIAFSYLEQNKSKGIQQLNIANDIDGTQIIHTTRYLSGNHLRDNHIYEPFHVQFTDDFYQNIEMLITD